MARKLRQMPRTIQLPLYGAIEHGPEDNLSWELYQSEHFSRLRDISLSSVPSRFMPHGQACSRFQHSVGVAYLARKLCERRPFLRPHRNLLIAACLCHDIGSPPFSHVAEIFLQNMTRATHEQQTARMLRNGSELHTILSRYDIDGQEVAQIVLGTHNPLGPLVAGTIDLDNIDNSLHLLVSLGYQNPLPYHPLELIQAFHFSGGRPSLDSRHLSKILGWAEARRALYDLLHSKPNLSSASMLYRALELAYSHGDLAPSFFRLGESDALHHLHNNCGRGVGSLIDALLCWRQYPLVHEQSSEKEDPRIAALYGDWQARKNLADHLAHELNLRPHELALYVGRDHGEKSISLPFTGPSVDAAEALFKDRRGRQKLVIFAHERSGEVHKVDAEGRIPRLERALKEALQNLPSDAPQGRSFF